MAVDTAAKRFSMIGLESPTVREQQPPTGTIGAPARAMLLFLYAGIALAAPVSLGAADACDTFYVQTETGLVVNVDSGFTVPVDPAGFSVAAENTAFTVPGCPSPT